MTNDVPLQSFQDEIFRDSKFSNISSWKWSSFFKLNQNNNSFSQDSSPLLSYLVANIRNLQTIRIKNEFIKNKNISGIRQSDNNFTSIFSLKATDENKKRKSKRHIQIIDDDDDSDLSDNESDEDIREINDDIEEGTEIKDEITSFYIKSINSKLRILVNQSLFSVHLNGHQYKSGEHAFQAEKFFHASKFAIDSRQSILIHHAHKIKNANTPQEAKILGSKESLALSDTEIEKWKTEALQVQEKICMYKYDTYRDVRDILNKYKGYLLFEQTRKKPIPYWRGYINSKTLRVIGENKLGKIWMKIREQKQRQPQRPQNHTIINIESDDDDDDEPIEIEELEDIESSEDEFELIN